METAATEILTDGPRSAPLSRRALLGAAGGAVAAMLVPHELAAATRVPAISYGARGRAVRNLNRRLAELTYLPRARVSGRFTDATFHALIAFQKHERLARDGIAGPKTRAALVRARPPRPLKRAGGERIEVDLARQLALLVRGGEVVRTVAVSTGGRGYATPPGRFAVYRRERRSWSTPYRVWLPWAAYFSGGFAFHAYPDVPPFAASHGCVRVPEPLARELYAFASIGRTVLVV